MKYIRLAYILFCFVGCGVKGKPLPPVSPPPFNDGKLLYQKDPANKPPPKTQTRPPDEEEAARPDDEP